MNIAEKIKPIKAFNDNYIWLFYDEVEKNAWVVDPGQAEQVITELNTYGLNLKGMFLTHHHYDHSGGISLLLKHWENASVYASYKSPLNFITHAVKDGDEISCANMTLKVKEIPGHTLDHIAFYNQDILFCGDTLFSVGCGKIFEGTVEQMYHSLDKLSALPPETKVFCGHEYTLANLYFAHHIEPNNLLIADKIKLVKELRAQNIPTLPSNLREEKLLNPFLRCDQIEIIRAVEKYTNKKLTDSIDVFANLREWKNSFKM